MTDEELGKRNAKMLSQLHPGIRAKVAAILQDLQGHGWRPRIQQAWRSAAEQATNLAKGTTTVKWSYHMAQAKDGTPEALAADLLDDDNPLGKDKAAECRFNLMVSSSAWAHGLNTGVFFGLKQSEKAKIVAAISAKDWAAVVPLGWDAGHVEVVGITLAQAKAGKRPPVPSAT